MLNRRLGLDSPVDRLPVHAPRPHRPVRALLVGILLSVGLGSLTFGQAREPVAIASDAAADADPVRRFLARVDEPLTGYRARRTLKARNERFNKDGWVTAVTELTPGAGFTYQIVSEGGSGYIRSRVLRKALEGERDAVAAGESSRAALSSANYRFLPDPREAAPGGAFDLLRIVPLRKDKLLIDGTITVTALDGDLVQIEGRLVKNPSFWTNRVEIVRRYGRIDGIRVPLGIESTANVKIAGTSVFSMTYEYESINGHPVSAAAHAAAHAAAQAVPQSASAQAPARRQ